LPKRLIPGTIALDAFTFTMTALPGSPAIQNAIPMPYFGTTPFAAPGLGLVGGVIMLGIGLWWLQWRAGRAAKAMDRSMYPASQILQARTKMSLRTISPTQASPAALRWRWRQWWR